MVKHDANRLAEVLEQENTALEAMDLPRAMALLPEKEAAFAALTAAGGSDHPGMSPVAERLNRLATENRRLLERAMTVQQRVIGIVAQAAAEAAAEPAYGVTGGIPGRSSGHVRPVAVSTRA